MELVILTGMSGSGKQTIMRVMEDIGFYCIDNLPPSLISKFVHICKHTGSMNRVALAVDMRSGAMFTEMHTCLAALKHDESLELKLVYCEASDEVLLNRYKETRRKHPLDDECGSLYEAIAYEREQLQQFRELADYYFETSYTTVSQLREEIQNIFLEKNSDSLIIKVQSFGYKYGVSTESDLVFDVRCLKNPYYIPELRNRTGLEEDVRSYVMNFPQSKELLAKLEDLLSFLIPLYISEGKSQLVIAFGCTGGKHRSVTFAELIGNYLKEKGYLVHKMHRDIQKDRIKK